MVAGLVLAMLDLELNRRNPRCSVVLAEHFRLHRKFQDPPPRAIFGERSTCRIDASPWPLRRIEKAPAWPGCGGPHADSRGDGCAGPHEGGSGAAAAVASDRGKDNIDTSPRSSSSPRPGPAPQSRPADLRTRTSHHPFVHYFFFPLCPLVPISRLSTARRFSRYLLERSLDSQDTVRLYAEFAKVASSGAAHRHPRTIHKQTRQEGPSSTRCYPVGQPSTALSHLSSHSRRDSLYTWQEVYR